MALYFDLDGTILNSAECSVVSARDMFLKFCDMDVAPEKIIEKMGIPIEVSFRELSGGKINDENWEDVATYFRARYKENTDKYTVLYDGIEEFLKDVSSRTKDILAVTSKKSSAAEHNLQTLKICSYFKHVIGSDHVEHYKPHPDPIYKARALISLAPDSLEIVIGDADTDIQMGKAAGVKTCAVTWGAHSKARLETANPDYIVEDVSELHKLIISLL